MVLKNYKKKGFTLIEILIVISIIAILSMIAIQFYISYRTESTKRALLADTKNCLNICIAKISDNTQSVCSDSDCFLGMFTASCTVDINGPVYVKCDGKGIISGYSCSVYQNGQISCS